MTNKPNDVRVSRELKCWSCKAVFTLSDHADCDGCCWKCGVEIDLDEMDIQPADQQGEPFFYALCGPDGKPRYDECCVADEAHHLECEEDGVTVVPLYRHAQPATAKVDEQVEFEKAYKSVVDNGWTNVKHMAKQVWQARAKLNGDQS